MRAHPAERSALSAAELSAEQLLDAIRARFLELQAIPDRDRAGSRRRRSAQYAALEAEIRSLARSYLDLRARVDGFPGSGTWGSDAATGAGDVGGGAE